MSRRVLSPGRKGERVNSDRPAGTMEQWEREEAYSKIRAAILLRNASDPEAALAANVSDKTVLRWRQRQNPPIPAFRKRS